VFGCGGVGDAAIAGAALVGASPIIAVDLDPAKLARAVEFGATHTVDASKEDPVEAIRALTGGFGADVCIGYRSRGDEAARMVKECGQLGTRATSHASDIGTARFPAW
jgi:Zn-dependent alcohol dehydrogenase